ncbi:uncharacterized protein LOC123542198 [Mercenaria mercenaria]|uniref:uncharacterized protein LOC123542198 n=1 Tax=Mercenaria mercenaria TaxID=6596 RepID=UPI00234E3D85|nr:uncharacterized protein LOC123542198 [Mercenaria mercenaria]
MDPESFLADQQVMFKMSNLLFGLLLIGFCLLAFYALCKWCSENSNETKPKETEKLMMKPVYAHEIEPGIVILQNEEGDYFKILKEYDSNKDNLYGSVSCTRPEMMQTPTRMPIEDPEKTPLRSHAGSNGAVSPSAPPVIPNPQGNSLEVNNRNSSAKCSTGYGSYGRPPPYASK